METQTTRNYGDRRRYTIRKAAEKIKNEVTIEDYLRDRGHKVRGGRAKCIVHGGDNPTSLSVDSEHRIWHCHACKQGGDLLDLVQLAEQHPDAWTAIVELSTRFDVPLPTRPPQWSTRQEEKQKVRAALTKAMARRYQRRLVKLYAPLILVSDEPEAEELAEIEKFSAEIWPLCVAWAEKRMGDVSK